TGLSANGPGAGPGPSPRDRDTGGPQPSVVPSAHIATTMHHEEETTITGSPPQSTLGAMGGGPDWTAAPAGSPPPAPTPAVNAFLPRRQLTRNETIVCLAAVLAWVILAAAGVAVSTKPYIDLIANADGKATLLGLVNAWFLVITCYTFTNI